MKTFTLTLIAILCTMALFAQSPQAFKYQAVARDGAGNVLANRAVSFRLSILQGNESGSAAYSETHTGTTNGFGLIDLEIGHGTPVTGTFYSINWSLHPYFLKVELDPNGGNSYQWMGTSQLLSVPYALHAKNVELEADGDSENELQKISISGTVLTLDKNGGSVTLPSSGGGDNWGTQTVVTDATISGNGTTSTPLKIADNGVNSSKILDGTITTIDLANNSVITPKITDLSVTTEKIVNTAVTSDKIANTAVTTEKLASGSVTTEKINNQAVTGTKIAQAGATTGQALKWNGTTWAPAADETGLGNPTGPAGGDLTGTYPNPTIGEGKITSAKILDGTVASSDLASNAVSTDKISAGAVTGAKIAQAGATTGQALKWNGTTWAPASDATGGSSSGWTDDGTIIRLTTTTDSVQMGSVNRLGKFNVGGNIGLNATSNIYFGSDATRITGLTGGDLRLVAEDLSMLTTEDITFGHYGDETWIKFDNANKRVGIGTLSPTDRFHSVLAEPTAGLSAIKGIANPTTVTNYGIYGESKSATGYGIFGKSPKYGIYGTATGNQGRGVVGEATNASSIGVQGIATNASSTGVWGEGSNQGVYGYSSSATGKGVYGKVASAEGYSGYFEGGKFYVKGNVEVRDTLIADALKIANSPRVAYEKFSSYRTITTLNTWGPVDTITLVAPGPGFVMLNFSGTFTTNHTYNDGTWVGVGISTSPTGGVLAQVWWEFERILAGGYYQSPCAVTTVAPVSAAGTKKYYIVSYHWGTSADEDVVHLNHGSFSALFIPSTQ